MTSVIYLAGKTDRLARDMEQQMNEAAAELDFEAGGPAAGQHLRAEACAGKQAVVFGDGTDADVGRSPTTNSKPPSRCSTSVADGCAGQRGWIVEKSGEHR